MFKTNYLERIIAIQGIKPYELAKRVGISPAALYRSLKIGTCRLSVGNQERLKEYIWEQTEAATVLDASLFISDHYNLVYRYAAMDASGTWKVFNTNRPPQRLMDQEIYTCQRYLGYFDERFSEVVDISKLQERIPYQKGGWIQARYHRDLDTRGWIHSPDDAPNITDKSVNEARARFALPFSLKELKRKRELDLIKIQHPPDDAAYRVDARTAEHEEQDERERKLKFTNLKHRRDE